MPKAPRTLSCLLLVLTTQLQGAHAQGNLCSLFTTAEVTKLLGTPVEGGDPLAPGSGCQWFGQDEESYVIIQVADTTNWIDPRQAPGYQALQGVGKKAYSHPEESGWRAMAITDKGVSAVVLSGGSAKREDALSILRKLVARP
jgi:hypothetical protein